MKYLIFIQLALLSIYSFAQPFQETILSSNFPYPYSHKSLDFNQDNYDDIIVSGGSELIWYKNQSGNEMQKIIIIDSVGFIRDFDIVDYNNNSELDIVGITNTSLFWLQNDGNMNFTYHLIDGNLSSLRSVRSLDMDNDSDIDIVYSYSDGSFVKVNLLERNLNSFTSTYIDRVDYSNIYLVDYNNDNYIDLLTKTNYSPFTTEELAIMINNGSNSFTEQQIYEKTGDIDVSDAHFVDMNNDGNLDLLFADYVQQELYWLQNCTLRRNILSSDKFRRVVATDFDNDNIIDIAYKSENSSNYEVHILKGSYSGSSMSFSDLYNIDIGFSSTGLSVADFDNNNMPELVYISAVGDEVGYFQNDSNFNFTQKKLAFSVAQAESMRRVDLDNDGDLDIVSIGSDFEIIWLDQQSDSTYLQKIIIGNLDNPIQIEVEDINGDGFLDIISASQGNARFSIWYNDGNQNFTEQALISSHSTLSNPSYFSIADLNNNGKKDFVIVGASLSSYNPKGIFWIRNDGNGNFSSLITIRSNLNFMGEVATYDFDNDGNIDIIVANHEYGSEGLHIIKNNSNATSFTYSTNTSFRAVSVRLGDINSDGLMDFVCRNDDNNDIVWFENTGNLNFTPHTIVMNEYRDVRFELCDDGNNGVTDILFHGFYYGWTNSSNHNVGLLKNDGNQNFTQTYFIQNINNILSAIPDDFDNDGDIDMFLGIDYANKISYFENLVFNLSTPDVFIWPTASDITYGDSLKNSVLSGDSASVSGKFLFADSNYIPNAGSYSANVVFIPDQDTIYASLDTFITIIVHKATPIVYQWPQASDIEFNQSLSYSVFSGDSTSVAGVFSFDNPSYSPSLGSYSANVTFTAIDTNNYNSVAGSVNLNVIKANPIISQWPIASEIDCGDSLGNSVLNGGSASTSGSFVIDSASVIPSVGVYPAGVTFIPSDSTHYNSVSSNVNIKVKGIDTTIINDVFCENSSYDFFGIALDSAATYFHNLSSTISSCDSVIRLNLTANPVYEFIQNEVVCNSSTFTWRGNTYSNSGTFYDSLSTVNACDSVYVLNLVISSSYEFIQNENICDGENFVWRGNNYSNSGTYYDSLSTSNNCDSVYILNLTVNPTYEFTQNMNICSGGNFVWRGNNYSNSGTYYDSLSTLNNCDSVYILNLTVNPTYEFTQNMNICSGGNYIWRGNAYSNSGTYYDSLSTLNNCDSVYILNLTVNPTYEFTQNENICDGGNFLWRGNTYSNSGTYYDSLSSLNNCDSVYILNLTVNPTYEFTQNENICDGGNFLWRGNTYSNSGTYYDSLSTLNNCDSVYILNLTVNPTYEFTQNENICDGGVFNWRGNNYSSTGMYYDSLSTVNGCDSVYTLNLSVNPNYEFIQTANICNGDTFNWRGNNYSNFGIYFDSLLTINACDSVFILSLSLNPLPQEFNLTGGGPYPQGGLGVPVGLSASELNIEYSLLLNDTLSLISILGTGNSLDFGNQTFAGVYTVKAIDTITSCSNFMNDSAVVEIINSFEQIEKEVLRVYPNPTSNLLTIEIDEMQKICLIDMRGKVLIDRDVELDKLEISLMDYSKGIYLLRVNTKKKNYNLKVILQ